MADDLEIGLSPRQIQRRKYREALKSDPERWENHLQKRRDSAKRRLARIKADPQRAAHHYGCDAKRNRDAYKKLKANHAKLLKVRTRSAEWRRNDLKNNLNSSVRRGYVKWRLAKSLGIDTSLIKGEFLEAKLKQLNVLKAIRDVKNG